MRIVILMFLLGSTMLLSNQCKTKKNADGKDTMKKDQKDKENEEKHQHTTETVLVSGDFNKKGSAPVEIKKASIKGNELNLTVSHSGGCGAHHFKLMGSKGIMKSMPPIRGLYLYHDNKGDQCRELLEHQITFDISDFAYQQKKGSEIQLRLDGWKGDILYSFSE